MFDRYDIDRWLLWIWYLSNNLYKHCQHLRSSFLSMRPITSAQKENILSLASNGHSTRYIASSWMSASLLSPEYSKTSFPTISHLILVVLPSSLPPLNVLSLHKSPQERSQMCYVTHQ